jgi:hypothetical protein
MTCRETGSGLATPWRDSREDTKTGRKLKPSRPSVPSQRLVDLAGGQGLSRRDEADVMLV